MIQDRYRLSMPIPNLLAATTAASPGVAVAHAPYAESDNHSAWLAVAQLLASSLPSGTRSTESHAPYAEPHDHFAWLAFAQLLASSLPSGTWFSITDAADTLSTRPLLPIGLRLAQL
jgi:hypothetical protein